MATGAIKPVFAVVFVVRRAALAATILAATLSFSVPSLAATLPGETPLTPSVSPETTVQPPADLQTLLDWRPERADQRDLASERRHAAMGEAALAWAAQAGLAHGAFEIQQHLLRIEPQLDAIYRFADLMVRNSGFTIHPPVIVETRGAFRREETGIRASRATRVLRIVEPAVIVSRPPDWRGYLYRAWKRPSPPESVLFPRNADEEVLWARAIRAGWAEGLAMARAVFADDLARLERDFLGIIVWAVLLEQRMVTAPEVDVARRAVAGGGAEMGILEVRAEIFDRARLNPVTSDWQPRAEGRP